MTTDHQHRCVAFVAQSRHTSNASPAFTCAYCSVPMEAASFSSCLTREDFLIIQSFLPISDVVRLASLYNREWLSATRKTISDRTEVLGSLIEIHESELRGHQGIQLGEYIRLDSGKYRPIRELQELSPRHLKHLTELQFKPIHSSKYFPIPEGACTSSAPSESSATQSGSRNHCPLLASILKTWKLIFVASVTSSLRRPSAEFSLRQSSAV
ncbi:hypothetical protein L596_026434 [Steinernema carpocapsae]|uniref:Uncharacterized protein n=1 Tax=Steinernema carpocapsae TaxID=34508 RepID=A0A4U5M1H3_STECR|nr:hypothetical protein L596_026434 [Steinernema carpocapsae]